MKLIEESFLLTSDGVLQIPAATMKDMGLHPGDEVTVAYLAGNENQNLFREFYIGSLQDADGEATRIGIPTELLQNANIAPGDDLNIICLDGCILLCRDALLNEQELYEVLDALDITTDIFDQLAPDPEEALAQLIQELPEILEGAEEYDEL